MRQRTCCAGSGRRRQGFGLALRGLAVLALAPGCGGDASTHGSTGAGGAGTATATATTGTASTSTGAGGAVADFTVGGDRPVTVHVPPSYTSATPAPLLIMLHGYGATGALEELYLKLGPAAAAHGMLYLYPDGTVDSTGQRFWNATDACCNLDGSPVDDSTYLKGLVDEVKTKANVDAKRVYVVGNSNGGFMSYRMACDHADDIAAIVSLAGATYANQASCKPSSPVAVLEIHGTSDAVVSYAGGTISAKIYPSAEATVGTWGHYDGCDPSIDTTGAPHDIDDTISGPNGPAEATVETHASGCMPGGHAELWTIPGGSHLPTLASTVPEQMVAYLLAHPKP